MSPMHFSRTLSLKGVRVGNVINSWFLLIVICENSPALVRYPEIPFVYCSSCGNCDRGVDDSLFAYETLD